MSGRESFYWWDDAVMIANRRAANSGRRQRVELHRPSGRWCVSEVER